MYVRTHNLPFPNVYIRLKNQAVIKLYKYVSFPLIHMPVKIEAINLKKCPFYIHQQYAHTLYMYMRSHRKLYFLRFYPSSLLSNGCWTSTTPPCLLFALKNHVIQAPPPARVDSCTPLTWQQMLHLLSSKYHLIITIHVRTVPCRPRIAKSLKIA